VTDLALPDLLDRLDLRQAPLWVGPSLLVLSLCITILGRASLRLLNGVLLCVGWFCAAFFGLRGLVHDWIPGVAAVLAGAVGLLLGLVQPAVGTGLLLATVAGPTGALVALQLQAPWPVPAGAAALVAFCLGFAGHKRVAVWLPPLGAAILAIAGAQLYLHPRLQPELKIAAAAGLTVALLVLAWARDRRANAEGRPTARSA
jgi:hypothetical protein